jgi:hypothetical protein
MQIDRWSVPLMGALKTDTKHDWALVLAVSSAS